MHSSTNPYQLTSDDLGKLNRVLKLARELNVKVTFSQSSTGDMTVSLPAERISFHKGSLGTKLINLQDFLNSRLREAKEAKERGEESIDGRD